MQCAKDSELWVFVNCVNFGCIDFELAGDVVCVFCVCIFLLACHENIFEKIVFQKIKKSVHMSRQKHQIKIIKAIAQQP